MPSQPAKETNYQLKEMYKGIMILLRSVAMRDDASVLEKDNLRLDAAKQYVRMRTAHVRTRLPRKIDVN